MKVKRFEGATLDDAVRAVKAEFGPEAVVLSTRSFEVPPRERGQAPMRRVEVTAAQTEDLSVVRRAIARDTAARSPARALPPELAPWQDWLAAARVAPVEADEVMTEALRGLRGGAVPVDAVAAALESRWPTRGPLRMAPGRSRVLALTGRWGEGRSTLARKLARRAAGVAPGRVLLLDCVPGGEGWATAAADPDLAGVESLPAPDPWVLADQLQAHRDAVFVVLDLPGINPQEAASVAAVAELVVTVPGADVVLVASAATAADETRAAVDALPEGGVAGLALTHLDDAARPGAVLEVAARCGLPLAFLSSGRQASLGLELASWAAVLRQVETRAASRPRTTASPRRAELRGEGSGATEVGWAEAG